MPADRVVAIAPITVADDDHAAVTVNARKVDVDGDPGYALTIENRSDRKAYVYSAPGWTIGGDAVDDPVLLEAVEPGQAIEGFMWFDHELLGTSSLDALKDVRGSIVVEDFETAAKIATYPFAA